VIAASSDMRSRIFNLRAAPPRNDVAVDVFLNRRVGMRLLGNHNVIQNAWIVNDIEEGIRRWTTVFGAGPFFQITNPMASEDTYRGKPVPTKTKVAIGQAGDLQIELIEVLEDGPNIYHEIVPKGTEGFHHVCISTPSYDSEVTRYNGLGYETVRTLVINGMRICYVDTSRDLGCMIEILEDNPAIHAMFRGVKEAGMGWDGITKPSRMISELEASIF
jgi:hypothetical protein